MVARFYGEYNACANRLDLREADVVPRATQEMPAIVEMIAGLVSKGAAYETADGVYLKVKALEHYGDVSGRHIDELHAC